MHDIKRKPTDLIWAVLYIVSLLGFIAITIFCVINGNPKTILMPSNSEGQLCGEGEFINKTKLYFFDITKCTRLTSIIKSALGRKLACPTQQVCVHKCPTFTGVPTLDNHVCKPGYEIKTDKDLANGIKNGVCSKVLLSSKAFFHRCLPKLKDFSHSSVTFNLTDGTLFNTSSLTENIKEFAVIIQAYKAQGEVVRDIKRVGGNSVLYLILPWMIALVLVIILGFGSYPIIIVFFFVSLFLCMGSTVVFSMFYYNYDVPIVGNDFANQVISKINSTLRFTNSRGNLGLSILFGIFTAVVLISGCLLFSGLRQVCACTAEASKAIFFLVLNFMMPFIYWIIQVALILWLSVVCIFLYTLSDKEYRFLTIQNDTVSVGESCHFGDINGSSPSLNCIFSGYQTSNIAWTMLGYSIFVIIWSVMMVRGIQTFQVAFTFAYYYWNRGKVGFFSFFSITARGLFVCFIFHLGSIALGTFIITIIFSLQILVEFLLRFSGLRESQRFRTLSRWVQVALSFIQTLMERLTTTAFIHVAVSGNAFCKSTFKVISSFARFPSASILILLFVKMVLVLGLVSVPTITGFLVYYHATNFLTEIENPLLLSIIFACLGALISASVFSVYCTGILTIHHCACHDITINNGSDEKPYHMSSRLKNAYGVTGMNDVDENKKD